MNFRSTVFAGAPLIEEFLAADHHRRPSGLRPVLQRIGRIELLDVQILLVEAENSESPGDVLVVAEGDSRQARFAGANDIPSRSDEMNHVAQRGQREYAVRVIGKQRLAARGQRAGDRPVVASLARLAGELDALVAADQILEQIGREPGEIDARRRIQSDRWIEIKQLRGLVRAEFRERARRS